MKLCRGEGCSQKDSCLRHKKLPQEGDTYFDESPREYNFCVFFTMMTHQEKQDANRIIKTSTTGISNERYEKTTPEASSRTDDPKDTEDND